MYTFVFFARYLDLFTNFVSVYNTIVKIFYLVASVFIIYLICKKFKSSENSGKDSFRLELILIPSLVLSMIWNYEFSFMEVLWTFSIYLEAVAVLPQFWMIYKTRGADSMMRKYLTCLGLYRSFYILNWIYRYEYEGDKTRCLTETTFVFMKVFYCRILWHHRNF